MPTPSMAEAPGTVYTLHSRFSQVCNYISPDGDLQCLSLPALGAGPGVTLVARLPDPPPRQLILGSGNQWIAPTPLATIDSNFDPQLAPQLRGPAPSSAWRNAVQDIIQTLQPMFPPSTCVSLPDGPPPAPTTGVEQALKRQLAEGVATLQAGAYVAATRQLKGVGPGLTPAGDDILCGFLWALSTGDPAWDAVRATIYENARGLNPISNHFLKAARQGHFFEHIQRWVEISLRIMQATIDSDTAAFSQRDLTQACQRVLQHGATSGADTLSGLLHGWHHMARAPFRQSTTSSP